MMIANNKMCVNEAIKDREEWNVQFNLWPS